MVQYYEQDEFSVKILWVLALLRTRRDQLQHATKIMASLFTKDKLFWW
jgi:hypothetical protein